MTVAAIGETVRVATASDYDINLTRLSLRGYCLGWLDVLDVLDVDADKSGVC